MPRTTNGLQGIRFHSDDPWLGWSFGYDYDWDWFNWGFGFGLGFGFGGWWGGWWGPMAYCPAYIGRGFARRGFYGRNGNFDRSRFFHNNDIYRDRQGVANRGGSGRLMTDRMGIFSRDLALPLWEIFFFPAFGKACPPLTVDIDIVLSFKI
jgi:hypothetical protein